MVRVRRSQHAMLFPILFFLRRIIIAVAVIVLIDYPTCQIFLFILPTNMVLMHLGTFRPLITKADNNLEIYNSYTIFCLTYCLLCLTQYVSDGHARYQVGYAIVILTCQNILINIFIIGKTPIRKLFLKWRQRWRKRYILAKSVKLHISKTLNSAKKYVIK